LFKEMITTKGREGTGMGLFLSYSNIRAHFNGNISFETEEGKGTSFYIELPLNLNLNKSLKK
ncbi:MAG: ATP-binding protein, partial [Oscillospiraceae bacterium]|nr:ATP-binding protein [Oscillospiraceae bacterium]